ncbi:MAG: hypothetical protein KAJ49_09555, partial [Arcobacteraceae bacterium]|nr:hypothetical protein [Arcobacteraceae bacterium]
KIASIFGINISHLDKDPIELAKNGDTTPLKVSFQIQTMLEIIANTQTVSTTQEDISKIVNNATSVLIDIIRKEDFDTNATATFNTIIEKMGEDTTLTNIASIGSSLETIIQKIDQSVENITSDDSTISLDILNATQINILNVQSGFNTIINTKLSQDDTDISSVVNSYNDYLSDHNISNEIIFNVPPTIYRLAIHNINESISPNTLISTIPILDSGTTQIESMSLLGIGSENFNIDKYGHIKVSSSGLDYETYQEYNLTAIASNSVGNSKPVTIEITINNIMDEVAILGTFGSESIFEHATIGTDIGKIDINSTGDSNISSFELYGTNHEYFNISNSGIITVAIVPDYETINNYNLTAYAINQAGRSEGVAVNISIKNIDAPSFNNIYINPISEISVAGTSVGNIYFTPSPNANTTSITLSGYGASNFNVTPNGAITVANGATLDYETYTNYPLSAYATNIEGDSASIEFIISITDVDETTPSLDTTSISVVEIKNILSETSTKEMTIISSGGSSIIQFYLSGIGSEKFDIEDNGTIKILENANFDFNKSDPSYTIAVIAENDKGNSTAVNLNVTILNIPEVTPIVENRNLTKAEDITNGTLIDNNFITNFDKLDGVPSYTLYGDGASDFNINSAGELRVASNANIDYETKNEYNLTLSVYTSDNGFDSNISTSNINISISNVTDEVPIISSFSGSVDENATTPPASITPSLFGNYDTNGSAQGVILSSDGTKAYV